MASVLCGLDPAPVMALQSNVMKRKACLLALACAAVLPTRAGEKVALSAASFTLSFAADGSPSACQRKADGRELLKPGNGGQGFYVKAPDTTPRRLDTLSLQPDGKLSVASTDGERKVFFQVRRGERYLALRIERSEGFSPGRFEELHFEMNATPEVRVLDLDYMTSVDARAQGARVAWPNFWHRSPEDPLGGFALYEKTGDDDEDQTLPRIWVEEKLPHPKVDGAWTLERARQWMTDWQRRFANRDQLILAGRSIAELHEGVEFARRAGIQQIYLFTDTWRTDPFWPVADLNWGVSRRVFPRGETDLREFSGYVRGQGMYLALHYVSGGIGLRDPLYVGQKPDRRFASWGSGHLGRAAGAEDTTLIFQPAPGVVPPAQHRPAYPHFFEWNMLRIGDELVRIGTIEAGTNGVWTLNKCQRGQGSTKASAHPLGENSAGLLLAYGQNFIPDNDSTLLGEIAQNYAGVLNRCVVEHAEFDGAEIHCDQGRWGYRKFATRVYEALDHPTTSHDSSGSSPAAWFEYRLNSSQRLMRGSCAYTHGNYSVPVALASPSRPATTVLDAQFTLSQGNYGGALGICKPEPMFGVPPQTLKEHGLTSQFLEALQTWREVDRLLTDELRERLNADFARPQGASAIFNHHLCSPVVPVARKVDTYYEIVPTRVLTRPVGDILWQHGQEHGALSPRQFIKPGQVVSFKNPDAPQPLQFILHVLPAFDPQAKVVVVEQGGPALELTDTEIFTEDNNQPRPMGERVPTGNVLLQPLKAPSKGPEGPTSIRFDGDALVLSASNDEARMWRETEKLPTWNIALNMVRRRGVGMWVTGDNSGALVLLKLGRRDYVVPIDFTGRRYVEIPNGEVSWASSAWGWRMETKSTDYSKVRSLQIGIGQMPPGRKTSVKIEQLIALGEIPVALESPVVHIGSGQLRVQGALGSGQFLQYTGGDKATRYDENWHQLGEVPVERNNYIMPTGQATVAVSSEQTAPTPWLDVQFITIGTPMTLTNR